jgi:diaminohydroxyphosphoribosylaminopyrimidine deaminase/5-amino-6-(5-phosphoribosylamino)uracil reductase
VQVDELFMHRALGLAERGRGRTSPNPMVGALVVDDDGIIVGRGAHEFAGGPHAEIHALNDAGARARGATLYCTLEPCSHTGRTGPCAPRLAEAGIRRVVIAGVDPNPLVAGRGVQLLRDAGIAVTIGVGREEAERLNRPFFTVMKRRRPFVTMKVALSADLRIAGAGGMPVRLTGASADRLVQRERAEVDAIAVGVGTVLADDPRLTARAVHRSRPLVRVVFDRRFRTPASARLFSTLTAGPVIIIGTPPVDQSVRERAQALERAGASVELAGGDGDIGAALERLATLGITSVVVEGGVGLHRAFWDAGVVDRVQVFITPRAIGVDGLAWIPLPVLAAGPLTEARAGWVGEDVLIEAYVYRAD